MRISKRLVAKAPKRGSYDYQIESMKLFREAVLDFGRALVDVFMIAKENIKLDDWEFFDKRSTLSLEEHKSQIRLPDGEYRLETSFGEDVPYTITSCYPIGNFEAEVNIPKNAGQLYVFIKK